MQWGGRERQEGDDFETDVFRHPYQPLFAGRRVYLKYYNGVVYTGRPNYV